MIARALARTHMSHPIPSHAAASPEVAKAAHLHYIPNGKPGISRLGKPGSFRYMLEGDRVRDPSALERIRLLAIPPAWSNVWICKDPNGHLQATGYDVKGRKQYRYHAKWSALRSSTKFKHALEFGSQLATMRKQLSRHLDLPGLPLEKVLAAVVSVMEHTQIRIGQDGYVKANGTFGLSTMKDRHVRTEGKCVRFVFKGKEGIHHDIRLGCSRLSRLVMRCKELPGQDLFQYMDDEGHPHPIDSGMVNDYIRTITNGDFTSKDIRTWKGTVHGTRALLTKEHAGTVTERTRIINAALDDVASHLGNTRTVCRKYYVHPAVIKAYEDDSLRAMAKGVRSTHRVSLEERVVLNLLARNEGVRDTKNDKEAA